MNILYQIVLVQSYIYIYNIYPVQLLAVQHLQHILGGLSRRNTTWTLRTTRGPDVESHVVGTAFQPSRTFETMCMYYNIYVYMIHT